MTFALIADVVLSVSAASGNGTSFSVASKVDVIDLGADGHLVVETMPGRGEALLHHSPVAVGERASYGRIVLEGAQPSISLRSDSDGQRQLEVRWLGDDNRDIERLLPLELPLAPKIDL